MHWLASLRRLTNKAPAIGLQKLGNLGQLSQPAALRTFSTSNNPLNNDKDAAEAYPMRIVYQKELLKEFEKQQRIKILKQYEEEVMEESIKGVFPEVVEDQVWDFPFEKESLKSLPDKNIADKHNVKPELMESNLYSETDDEISEYEMMIAYRRLQFKLMREKIKNRKNMLRAHLNLNKK